MKLYHNNVFVCEAETWPEAIMEFNKAMSIPFSYRATKSPNGCNPTRTADGHFWHVSVNRDQVNISERARR